MVGYTFTLRTLELEAGGSGVSWLCVELRLTWANNPRLKQNKTHKSVHQSLNQLMWFLCAVFIR